MTPKRIAFHLHEQTLFTYVARRLLPDYASVHAQAVESARDIMAEAVKRGRLDLSHWIGVVDEDGRPVLTLPFSEAVELDPPR
jgi:hypothetical protein